MDTKDPIDVNAMMRDDLRAQEAKYDALVQALESMAYAPGHAAKICKEAASELRLRKPDFALKHAAAAESPVG